MSEKEEFSKLSSIKKCPICRGKLVKGYFTIPKAIGGWHWDTYDNAPALKCERCGIAILDYGAARKTPESFLKKCVKCGKKIPLASEECPKCGTKQKENEE